MYSAYPPTIEKMYCLQQVLFASMNFYLLWYFVFPSCLRSIWKFTLCNSASVFYLLAENITICPLLEDGGPLPVFFKLPISEISEIDDHKSVTILLFFSFLSVLLACLSYWKPILGHSLTSLLVFFQALLDPTILIFTIVSLYSDWNSGMVVQIVGNWLALMPPIFDVWNNVISSLLSR